MPQIEVRFRSCVLRGSLPNADFEGTAATRLRRYISLLGCALVLASVAAGTARASETQQLVMEDERHLLALRMPLIVRDIGGGQASVWGASYGRSAGRETIVREDGRLVAELAPSNERGYFEVTVPLYGPGSQFASATSAPAPAAEFAGITPGI